MEPLKLYVNKEFVAPGMSYIPLLFPYWGPYVKADHLYPAHSTPTQLFDKRYAVLVENPAEAEYVLVPHDYWRLKNNRPDLLEKIVEEAQRHNKPLLVDASGDMAGVVEVPNAKVLRINQYRFDLPPYEIKVPFPCQDLLEEYCDGQLSFREKSDLPSVGFVGWASINFKQRVRTIIKELPVRIRALVDKRYKTKIKGIFWRERANKIFQASSRIKANFIIRSSYSGNVETLQGDREKNRREFVDNIINNDYALIIRGDANEATRFYEVLSLGRIPVLIDTAVVLPLEQLIQYQEFCVIINHAKLKQAPDILADFHAGISPEQFIDMQRKARHAFETFLRYDKFSKYLVEMLRAPLVR